MLPSAKKILQAVTFGAENFKRGAIVGGFEFNVPYDIAEHFTQDDRDREAAQFLAASMPTSSERPLHHFYVTEVTDQIGDRTPHSYFTVSVHVENLAQVEQLFLKYDDLTVYP